MDKPSDRVVLALLWVGGGLGEGSMLSLWPQDRGCIRAISPAGPSAQHLRTRSLLAEAGGVTARGAPWWWVVRPCLLLVFWAPGPSFLTRKMYPLPFGIN